MGEEKEEEEEEGKRVERERRGERPTIKNSNRKQSRGSEDRTSPNGNYLGWF